MIKKTMFFLVITAIAAMFFTYGCNLKTTTTTWGPTETSTPVFSVTETQTITVTFTITPTSTVVYAAQSHFYTFDAGLESWVNGSANLATDGYGTSVVHNTNTTYTDLASAGSLQLETDFSIGGQEYALTGLAFGTEQNFEYHTITARIYIPATLWSLTDPLHAGVFIHSASVGGGTSIFYSYDVTGAGWHDLSAVINTAGAGLDYYQHIDEMGVIIYKDATCTETDTGTVYIDNVAW